MSKFDHRHKDKSEEELEKLEAELDTPDDKDKDPEKEEETEDEDEEILDKDDSGDPDGEDEDDPAVDEDEEETEDEDEEDPPTPPKPKVTPPTPERPLEEKLNASTREALVQASKTRKIVEAIDDAKDLEVSEDQLKSELLKRNLNIEMLTDSEKAIWKENITNTLRFEKVRLATEEGRKIEDWSKKVDEFLDNPENISKYGVLAGNEEDFKRFTMKPTRRGVDIDDLVAAFGYQRKAITKPKGSLLLSKSNGRMTPPKPKAITADDLATIRRTNPKKYAQLIKSGKIDDLEF